MYFRQLANKSSFLLQFTKCSILGVFILVNQSYKSKSTNQCKPAGKLNT